MPRRPKLTAVLLALIIFCSAGGLDARVPQPPPPLPPGVSPHWTPAPGNHRVAYAPNIPADLFWYGNWYYYYYGGYWYRGKSLYGRWHLVRHLPRGIYRLHRAAFKYGRPW
ncbi:MAG: hypothetical protein AB1424_18285 [Thermodesulfobacteriota bacterium]